ncbi:hypothetical protein [Oleiagrimonas sp.]|jgi:hypothetical protein|uniref:hypothetical protein n=1 Tax=Oleiagrimonas sp. TaxID=2010330 RepID=UPI00260F459D|nr:hypothetical protein [Oleiagrimonas sp.]MDA3914650.1 hypothetical protein [Oleiagrimonas sp.]
MHPRPVFFARMRFAYPGYALMTFSDDFRIMLSPHGVPDDLDKLIRQTGCLPFLQHPSSGLTRRI